MRVKTDWTEHAPANAGLSRSGHSLGPNERVAEFLSKLLRLVYRRAQPRRRIVTPEVLPDVHH